MAAASPIPCTVAVLTKNSGATLPRALESVQAFAELLVCDGGSTDGTLEIARAAGARIITQDPKYLGGDGRIIDFAGVRNQTLEAATQPWFFFLDSDEYVNEALVDHVRSAVTDSPCDAYVVLRRYVYNGQEIDCAYSYPNRSMRLFRKSTARAFIKKIHERISLNDGARIGTIAGALLVPVDPDIQLGRQKGDRYIKLQVAQAGDFSWHTLFQATGSTLRASLSYGLRTLRSLLWCRGNRLPLVFDWEAQVYNARLIKAYWAAKLRQYRSS